MGWVALLRTGLEGAAGPKTAVPRRSCPSEGIIGLSFGSIRRRGARPIFARGLIFVRRLASWMVRLCRFLPLGSLPRCSSC